MILSEYFSTKKKLTLASLSVMALLLISGSFSSVAFGYSSSTPTPPSTSYTYASAPPTFVGSSGHFLSGPFLVSSAFGGIPSSSGPPKTSGVKIPSGLADSVNAKPLDTQLAVDPPGVTCSPPGSGCEAISSTSGATTNPMALNAVNNYNAFGYSVEPPDQAVCANSQFVMESLNIGIVQVYNSSSLMPVSTVASLDNLMGLPSQGPLGWSSAGDVSCLFDASNGGHWFITEIVSTTPEQPLDSSGQPGPFQGCFVAVFDTCREGIAVSVTSNPMGAYYVYFLDPNAVNHDPGVGYLLNDFAKIGNTRDAFMLFYDEYILNSASIPPKGFGSNGFNGAQEFAFSKLGMEFGVSSMFLNVAYENMGTASNIYPIPANGAFQPAAGDCTVGLCWYEVIPAASPDPTQFNNHNGGTGYMVGSLDFFSQGDNRIAVFTWTGLSALNGFPAKSGIMFGGQLLTTGVVYLDAGAACLASSGLSTLCGLGQQKTGKVPLGKACVAFALNGSDVKSCPESGLATNGDGATQASYANGVVWTGVDTQVVQSFGSKTQTRLGVTYWGVNTGSKTFTLAADGYVSAPHADLEFPAIAATDNGSALMSFTLSGPKYFPSSAYTWLGPGQMIHITALGQGAEDGFSEYQGYTSTYGTLTTRPRWGDYGAAVFVPSSTGGLVIFATEYIQSPNCNTLSPTGGISCGGTRVTLANWGSSINSVPAG
ncbi:MAG TPA: hypothetical protein VJN71_00450 [Nitrososphaerales archaeon]|nr:hypothetical protein [Nitrososphaerales archaeon]